MGLKKEKRKYIISASRREDMIAFSPDRLEKILNGSAAGPLKHIRPQKIHTLVLWTRDFRNSLGGSLFETLSTLKSKYSCQIVMHLTVTGLAGTLLEPKVPLFKELKPLLPDLIGLLGNSERIFWRYDPLISIDSMNDKVNKIPVITNINEKLFSDIALTFSEHGIKKCITSIVTPYEKVLKRLKKEGLKFRFHPEKEKSFLYFMKDFLESREMRLQTCCTNVDQLDDACISHAELRELHSQNFELDQDKSKPGQRENCLCDKSWDIGWYRKCPHECIYCYARP